MTEERAKDILMVHACCSFTNKENKLCEKCPWNNTVDCEETVINEKVIIKAINALKC